MSDSQGKGNKNFTNDYEYFNVSQCNVIEKPHVQYVYKLSTPRASKKGIFNDSNFPAFSALTVPPDYNTPKPGTKSIRKS